MKSPWLHTFKTKSRIKIRIKCVFKRIKFFRMSWFFHDFHQVLQNSTTLSGLGNKNTLHGLSRLQEASKLLKIVFLSKHGLTNALKVQLLHSQTNFITDIRIPDKFFTFISKMIIGINNSYAYMPYCFILQGSWCGNL